MNDLAIWMERAVLSSSWERFDDYHVDGGAADRDIWVARALEQFEEARHLRSQRFPGFAVLLAFSFAGRYTGFPTVDVLRKALDWSPPSLYVFKAGSELLATAISDASAVEPPPFAPSECLAYMRRSPEDAQAGSLLLLDAG
jgi:hypothetical protein